jgi:hypothetical protein
MDGLIKEGIIKYVGNVFTLVKLVLDQITLATPVNSLQIEWILMIVHVKMGFLKLVLIMVVKLVIINVQPVLVRISIVKLVLILID